MGSGRRHLQDKNSEHLLSKLRFQEIASLLQISKANLQKLLLPLLDNGKKGITFLLRKLQVF